MQCKDIIRVNNNKNIRSAGQWVIGGVFSRCVCVGDQYSTYHSVRVQLPNDENVQKKEKEEKGK